jgi:phosphatidylglycerophosphate synthase
MTTTGILVPGKSDAPESSDKIDFYKLCREEYRDRYESMRSLEWKVLFQAYAGYAAIAVAFSHLKPWHANSPLYFVAMLVTLFFFVATQYLCFRIQERLVAFGITYKNYTDVLSNLMKGSDKEPPPGPGTSRLGHSFFWTYETQLCLAFLTFTGLLGYEAILTWHTYQPLDVYLLVSWFLVTVAGGAFACRLWWIVKITYRETLNQYRPATREQPTIWKAYKDQKKSGTRATART